MYDREACAKYREKNREELNRKARERRAADPEKHKAITRKSMAKAYASDPEKFRHRNREEQKRRYARDPSQFVANGARRRARGAVPAWADPFVISEIYDLARLRTKSTGIKWAVDHIVPLQSELVCGLHCEANLRVIPDSLNKSKGNRCWPGHPDPARHVELDECFF